jgi:hypothetical protein
MAIAVAVGKGTGAGGKRWPRVVRTPTRSAHPPRRPCPCPCPYPSPCPSPLLPHVLRDGLHNPPRGVRVDPPHAELTGVGDGLVQRDDVLDHPDERGRLWQVQPGVPRYGRVRRRSDCPYPHGPDYVPAEAAEMRLGGHGRPQALDLGAEAHELGALAGVDGHPAAANVELEAAALDTAQRKGRRGREGGRERGEWGEWARLRGKWRE